MLRLHKPYPLDPCVKCIAVQVIFAFPHLMFEFPYVGSMGNGLGKSPASFSVKYIWLNFITNLALPNPGIMVYLSEIIPKWLNHSG